MVKAFLVAILLLIAGTQTGLAQATPKTTSSLSSSPTLADDDVVPVCDVSRAAASAILSSSSISTS